MITESTNNHIPQLRFPEFQNDGEWEVKRLGEIAEFYKGKGISKNDVSCKGEIPCVRYGELYTHYKEVIVETQSFTDIPIEELFLSKANDVIIPSSGETKEDISSASCVLKDNIALGGDINVIRGFNDGVFLSYYLNYAKKNDIAKIAQGVSIIHLYNEQLKNLQIYLPSIDEQHKIAECLSAFDILISATNDKLEQLKAYKKGLMQKLFPAKGKTLPEYRFKEFEKDGEWKVMKLGEIITEVKDTTNDSVSIPLYSLTIDEGITAKNERYERGFLVTKKDNVFKVVSPNDFVSNPMNLRLGAIGCNHNTFSVCVSGYYDVFRFKESGSSVFWVNYLKSDLLLHKYDEIAIGSLIEKRRVYYSNLQNLSVLVPTIQEQRKIADCLSLLDEIINAYAEKVVQLGQYKKGLMQQMFPTSNK